jgi:hypothetical protein
VVCVVVVVVVVVCVCVLFIFHYLKSIMLRKIGGRPINNKPSVTRGEEAYRRLNDKSSNSSQPMNRGEEAYNRIMFPTTSDLVLKGSTSTSESNYKKDGKGDALDEDYGVALKGSTSSQPMNRGRETYNRMFPTTSEHVDVVLKGSTSTSESNFKKDGEGDALDEDAGVALKGSTSTSESNYKKDGEGDALDEDDGGIAFIPHSGKVSSCKSCSATENSCKTSCSTSKDSLRAKNLNISLTQVRSL